MPAASLHDLLVAMFAAPVGLCDARGTLVSCNDAFLDWIGEDILGAYVEIHGTRGVLASSGGPVALSVAGLTDGGWLVLGEGDSVGAISAVTTSVARRLGRVEAALQSHAEMALQSGPSPVIAQTLREVLAVADEVRALREQTEALGGGTTAREAPVCLLHLLRDAARLLPQSIRVTATPDDDYTTELDRTRFFPLLVASLQELSDGEVQAILNSGEQVHLDLMSTSVPSAETPAISALRRFVGAYRGRVLTEPGRAIRIELPAYGEALATPTGQGTILVVDDNESTLAMIGATLRRAGFRVLTAEDGVIGSSLFRIHHAEIVAIVSDAVLPGRSGLDLIGEARRCHPGLPVLLISGHSVDILGGPDEDLPVLAKPFGARTLMERVRGLLDR